MTHDSYAEAYLADYGFEHVMVAQRRRLLLELIESMQPAIVLEIGCGIEPLFCAAGRVEPGYNCWITVEPTNVFAKEARRLATGDKRVTVIEAFAEEVDWSAVLRHQKPDLVLLSQLLHEVKSPSAMLQTIHELATPQTLVHANVPNANSLHRQLAVAMGLIATAKEPSERNVHLMQKRIFTAKEFRALFEGCGFQVVAEGGYFLKPFTHAQMEAIQNTIGSDALDGLYVLGRQLPDLASEIYLCARIA